MPLRRFLLAGGTFLLLTAAATLSAAQCGESIQSFSPGETIRYQIAYNWNFVWVKAGEVTFNIEETSYKGKTAWHMTGEGNSYKFYDFIYKVRDRYEVWTDTSLQPLHFVRDTREAKYEVYNEYTFDRKGNKIYAELSNSESTPRSDTLDWPSCTYDVLSMVYHARNLNFASLSEQDTIPISALIDGKVYDSLYVRYIGKEVIENRDGLRYRCIKFVPLLVEGTIFSGGEDMTVWVTDDNNRIPIMVEAKILVGSVKAYLYSYEGLRYPLEALMPDE